jgi:hypothetical protein
MALVTETVAVRSRAERMRSPMVAIGGLTVATLALHVRDPHVSGSWGVCPLYALTGLYCPGCGGLRGVNDLSSGHLGAAASSNLLLVVLAPVAVVLLGRWALASWRGEEIQVVPTVPRWLSTGLILLALAFTILRNLPGSWFAP